MPERYKGVVKYFLNGRGFGLIKPDDGGPDVHVDYSEIQTEGFKTLKVDDVVTYSVIQDRDGPQAREVRKISD